MLFAWVDDEGNIQATTDFFSVPAIYKGRVQFFADLTLDDKDRLYKDEFGRILVKREEVDSKILQEKIDEIVTEAVNVVLKKLQSNGFYSIGDVLVYSFLGDELALEMLSWYIYFDREVWVFIDEVLSKWSYDRVRSFDVKQFISDVSCFINGLLEDRPIAFSFLPTIKLIERNFSALSASNLQGGMFESETVPAFYGGPGVSPMMYPEPYYSPMHGFPPHPGFPMYMPNFYGMHPWMGFNPLFRFPVMNWANMPTAVQKSSATEKDVEQNKKFVVKRRPCCGDKK